MDGGLLTQVRIGSARWDSGGDVVKVVRQIAYPAPNFSYDIALIKLARRTPPRAPASATPVRRIGGMWTLVGATSRNGTKGAAAPACGGATIYTSVPYHRAWIEKTFGHKLPRIPSA